MLYTFWTHVVWVAIILALAVILEIEALVHTHYVVTADGKLLLNGGRFSHSREMEISSVILVRQTRRLTIAQPVLSISVLELVFRQGGYERTVCVSPRNVDAFIACLQRRNPAIEVML